MSRRPRKSKTGSVYASVPPPLSFSDPIGSIHTILVHRDYVNLVQGGILLAETLLCAAIIAKIRFTNIDWKAYMEQVETFISGERDYTKIRGETGPLVYPAGFLWIFAGLYYATERGQNIQRAQGIFALLYLITLAVVFRMVKRASKMPPYTYAIFCLSKRLHSLYMLRCFNDCVAMFFLYVSIWALCHKRFRTASVLFSVALSVKMSILLFLPAFGLVLLACTGLYQAATFAGLMFGVQLLLALPFLVYDWKAYLSRAFEFSRVFLFKWTVNWRFLPEEAFLSSRFSAFLLVGHALTLFWAIMQWCKPFGGFVSTLRRAINKPGRPVSISANLSPRYILTTLFSCNLIGMLFARSLHYQFYVWEAHQLVFLVWQTRWNVLVKLGLLIAVELGWETFPSTTTSSAALVGAHLIMILSLLTQIDWRTM